MTSSLQRVIFPGNHGQPCEALYGIHLYNENHITRAHIAVVQSDASGYMGTSLWNTDEGRNILLNKILAHDLAGVRVQFVRFSVIIDAGKTVHAAELPIEFDVDDYVAKGNPHDLLEQPASDLAGVLLKLIGKGQKSVSIWSVHVLGGCARFYTDFEQRRHIPRGELEQLLKDIDYRPNGTIA